MGTGVVEGPVSGVVVVGATDVVSAAADVVSAAANVVSAAADGVSACRIVANALVLVVGDGDYDFALKLVFPLNEATRGAHVLSKNQVSFPDGSLWAMAAYVGLGSTTLASAAHARPCSRARPCSPRSPLHPLARPCTPRSPLQPALAPAPRALPCPRQRHARTSALHCPRQRCPARCPALTCPAYSRCLRTPALPRAYRQLLQPLAHAPKVGTATIPTIAATAPTVPATAIAVATLNLSSMLLTATATAIITVLRQRQPNGQESLSPHQLHEWAIWWGSPGGGASRAHRQKPLLPQQHCEWAVQWGATIGGTCESTPAGSAASRRGDSGGGQQQQQHPLETLSSQQLREWAVQVGSPGGGGFRGTHTGGVEAPGGIEATSLNACDSAFAGSEPEEALHTFTLDSGTSRCFFRDSTKVTPLTVPAPVTLVDPSGGPVVARGATVLPYPAAPSGLLTGLHLPSFAKNLLVAICTDSRTGEHLATFTRRPGSGLYKLTTESALVAESGQVAVSVEVNASCSCRLCTHQTLLLHHRLGHPSLPRLRGMHSRLLVSSLPRSLPPLPRLLAPPCLPCVEGRQCAAPHSSSFPPTTSPLQTLHMDVWGPARIIRQGGQRYFLLVVDDYTCYTTVFPLQSQADIHGVLIRWIRAVRLQLRAWFLQDLPVLRLHSDRSVMEAARTSMIHAAAPHFLWPFAVRYATEMLNLWLRVSHPETSPTLRWTGEVGDASAFRFYHPGSRRVLSSRAVTFVEFVCFYRLHPHLSSPVALLPLSLVDDPPSVAPLPPPGPTSSCVSQVDPPPLVEPLEVSSETSGPADGGGQTATNTVVPRRSALGGPSWFSASTVFLM
ncbi:unnamed protein product [Closterium sp. NIES-54]